MDEKMIGLNDARELLFGLYPNAKSITVLFSADKIKVTPNEEYVIPLTPSDDEEWLYDSHSRHKTEAQWIWTRIQI